MSLPCIHTQQNIYTNSYNRPTILKTHPRHNWITHVTNLATDHEESHGKVIVNDASNFITARHTLTCVRTCS